MLFAAEKYSDTITRLCSVHTKAQAKVPYLLVAHGCNVWGLLVKVLKQRKMEGKKHRMSRAITPCAWPAEGSSRWVRQLGWRRGMGKALQATSLSACTS